MRNRHHIRRLKRAMADLGRASAFVAFGTPTGSSRAGWLSVRVKLADRDWRAIEVPDNLPQEDMKNFVGVMLQFAQCS